MAILILAFLVLLLGFIVWGLGVLAARRRPGVIRPQCGHCGYPVEGLPTFICPECGSDLREWGIRTEAMVSPRDWGWFGLLAKAAVWTMTIYVIVGLISKEVKRYARQSDLYTQSVTYERGNHRLLKEFVYTRAWVTHSGGSEVRELEATLGLPTGETIRIEVRPQDKEVIAKLGTEEVSQNLDVLSGDDIAAWYAAVGVPVMSESDRELATRLASSIQKLADHPGWELRDLDEALGFRFGATATTANRGSFEDRGLILATYTVGAGVWLAGIGLILFWRRKPRVPG